MGVSTLLVVIALLLAIGSFFRPQWPLIGVAVLLLAIAMLVGSAGTIHLGLAP